MFHIALSVSFAAVFHYGFSQLRCYIIISVIEFSSTLSHQVGALTINRYAKVLFSPGIYLAGAKNLLFSTQIKTSPN